MEEQTETPFIQVWVNTHTEKLHIMANRIHTYLESGNPKALYLVTGGPEDSAAHLSTLFPSVEVRLDIYSRGDINARSAVVVADYDDMSNALGDRCVTADDIGMLVMYTGRVCEWTSDDGGPEMGILDSVGGQGVDILMITQRGEAYPWSQDTSMGTTLAKVYDRPLPARPAPAPALSPDTGPAPRAAMNLLNNLLSTLSYRASPSFGRSECSGTRIVHLPNFLPSHLRTFAAPSKSSLPGGHGDDDAVCEALLALQGLADPLLDRDFRPLFSRRVQSKMKSKQPPVPALLDPWRGMRWDDTTPVYSTAVRLRMGEGGWDVVADMLTPVAVPAVREIAVYWDRDTRWSVVLGRSECLGAQPETLQKARAASTALFRTVFRKRMDAAGVPQEFPYLFTPREWRWDGVPARGRPQSALEAYRKAPQDCQLSVLEDRARYGALHIFSRWRPDLTIEAALPRYASASSSSSSSSSAPKVKHPDQPVLEATKFPERRDLLHPVAGNSPAPATVLLLPEFCTDEPTPLHLWQLALVLPGVLHRVGIALIAQDLQRTLLAGVGVSVAGISTALCTPNAREGGDYQRLEFLGDLALKHLVTLGLLDEHPHWHDEYLSAAKSGLVSNAHLAEAAAAKGLGRWIVTDVFTGAKWRPRCVCEGEGQAPRRTMSGKVLADVVEALAGAAYLEGGPEAALRCLQAFGLCGGQGSVQGTVGSLRARAGSCGQRRVRHLGGLERLLTYEFRDHALLLEATTHPAHAHSAAVNHGRLLVLGDAVLDLVVGRALHDSPQQLGPADMHLYKSAVVSGNLLAFLSLGWRSPEGTGLWGFVYVPDEGLAEARAELQRAYEGGAKDSIRASLDRDARYPWPALSRFEADKSGKNKYLADTVEALIAAVYIDSGGDLWAATRVVERLGVLEVLRRLVGDGVDVVHPVTRLEEAVAPLQKGQPRYVFLAADGGGGGGHTCTVMFDGRALAVARSSAASRSEARAQAAELGIAALAKAGRAPGAPGATRSSTGSDDGWD